MTRVVSFDTERFAPGDRLRAWYEHIEESVFEADITPFDPAGLSATSHSRAFDGIVATGFRTNQHVIQRTPQAVSVDPRSGLYISIMVAGEATFYRPNGSHVIHAGEALLYSPAEPYVLAFSPESVQLFVDIEQHVLRQRYETDAAGVNVKAHLDSLRGAGGSSEELMLIARNIADSSVPTTAVQSGIEDLLPMLINQIDSAEGSTYSRALRIIRTHGRDPAVTIAAVAELTHVSARQLSRAFSAHGTSPATELTRYRIGIASELIRGTDRLLSDIAFECGFGSISTMVRAFQRAGLGSPSSHRRASGSQPPM